MNSPPSISPPGPAKKYPWLWDVPFGNERFDAALRGDGAWPYDERWAMIRLIDYAPYRDLRRMLPKQRFVEMWPEIREKIRPREIREGMDFYYQRLKQQGYAPKNEDKRSPICPTCQAYNKCDTIRRMKTTVLHARIDPEVKVGAETILHKLGLNSTDAIRLFYSQIVLRRGLPFPVEIPNAKTRKAIKDSRAGKGGQRFNSLEEMFATWDEA